MPFWSPAFLTARVRLCTLLQFPELAHPAVSAKPPNAVAFSGGGTRAFSVTMGYLLGLHELDVLRSTRYISAVSGGTWASAAYTFVDPSAGPHVAQNDSQLLGRALPPSALDFAALDDLPAHSARHCCSVGVGFIPLSGAQYVEKIQSSFLTPLGIPAGASFSYDQATASAILQRNPTLQPSQLALPHRRPRGFEPPFLIMGITLMGPLASAPLSLSERSYTVFDATPLYVGQARATPVTFHSRKQLGTKQLPNVTLALGGLIEPFAVGGDAPSAGLPPQFDESVVHVPSPPKGRPFSLATAVAASSFFPGDVEGWLSKGIANAL